MTGGYDLSVALCHSALLRYLHLLAEGRWEVAAVRGHDIRLTAVAPVCCVCFSRSGSSLVQSLQLGASTVDMRVLLAYNTALACAAVFVRCVAACPVPVE